MVIWVCVRQRARDTGKRGDSGRGGGGNYCGCFYNSHSQKSCPENECSVPLPSERFLKWFKQNLLFQESRSASVNTAPEAYMHSTSKDLSMTCTWFQFVCVMFLLLLYFHKLDGVRGQLMGSCLLNRQLLTVTRHLQSATHVWKNWKTEKPVKSNSLQLWNENMSTGLCCIYLFIYLHSSPAWAPHEKRLFSCQLRSGLDTVGCTLHPPRWAER